MRRMNAKQEEKLSNGKVSNRLPKLVDAAGIDVGSEEHWVAVPEDRAEHSVRSFRCFTADLQAMAQWLRECKIKTVAMESTGVYWIPIFQILDRAGFEVKLVNARHVKNAPGRKTDVSDCQWLQRLHTYGLLNGSFRPNDQVCVLRSYWRHRDNLLRYATSHVLHMQKALSEMNIQLHKVITDITGMTGMRIIRAILAGERDPLVLANMKDHRIHSSVHDIVKALEGDYRQEHLFVLKQAVDLYDSYHQQQIEACDRQLEVCLSHFDSKIDVQSQSVPPAKAKGRKRRRNEPRIDLHTHLYRITGIDFTQIGGLDVLSVQTILAEVGLNPDAFPSEKHFASWLGLCPDNRITGGKIKSSKTRKVVNRAANAFRLAAQTMHHSASALGGYYRRMRAKLGAPKAITATAHKLARIFYRLWKTGESYNDPGADYYEQKYKERVLNNMKAKAKQLGYEITLKTLAGCEVS
jgi:transposase